MTVENKLTPASPIRQFETVRAGTFDQLDANNQSGMIGPGATLKKSRKLSTFVTGQTNAIIFGKGGNTNIFV